MKTIVTKNHHTLFLARVFLIIGLLTYAVNAYATIRYVKATSVGAGDGSNWDNASSDLQAMINASANGDEVWVAKGTYKRANSGESFRMAQGVRIFGGFAGNEENPAERDLTIGDNASILKGNGTYVVGMSGSIITNAAVLDGFTITDGSNGGIYNMGGSPTIRNCTIKNNTSPEHGAGIYNSGGTAGVYPVVINCSIENNTSTLNGGGIFFSTGITITNCSFTGNKAALGGGICNSGTSLVLTNCSFTSNTASNGGGMYNESGAPVLTNCSFVNNTATNGGAINNYNSSPKLRNCIIYGNSSGITTFFTNASPEIKFSLVQGLTNTNDGNISGNTDPLFVDPDNGDYRLQLCSPVINKGSNSFYGAGQTPYLWTITTDLAGKPRFHNGGTVDMGAYELEYNTAIVYVKEGGTGPGTSWDCATGDLQAAINTAQSGEEVWVAGGTYKRANSGEYFAMKEGVKIYGGFKGDETSLTQRNLTDTTNSSTLRGNGSHVIYNFYSYSNNLTSLAVLDGFTLTGSTLSALRNYGVSPTIKNCIIKGNTTSSNGGGMYNSDRSYPVLSNCSFVNNTAATGGAIYNIDSSPTLSYCTFTGNTANLGGGIYNTSNSSPTISYSTFTSNSASYAGAMYNQPGSSPKVSYCTFIGNSASNYGGGILNSNCSPTYTNCLFTDNTATKTGGGIYDSGSTTTLTNCTISGNTAQNAGGMYYEADSPRIRNTIIYGNSSGIVANTPSSPKIEYSLIQGFTSTDNKGNISGNINPLFVDPSTGNYRLQRCSPVINKGSNTYYDTGQTPDLTAVTADLAGDPRFYASGTVDLGAYEYQSATESFTNVIYVKEGGIGIGTSWDCATGDFQAAITAAAPGGKEVWVAKGSYLAPSNGSFVMQEGVKIYGGFAGDETSLDERDLTITANASTLTGNGSAVINNNYNNLTSAAVLDGFTVTGGSSSGIYNLAASPTIKNCIITDNTGDDGGGIYIFDADPQLLNCTITNNTATLSGGGIYNQNSSSTLTNCIVTGNTAVHNGGGIYGINESSPVLTNCTINGNSTNADGGGIYITDESSPTLINCAINDNKADGNGGGFYIYINSSPILTNCSIIGNTADLGGGMYNHTITSPILTNCSINGNKGGGMFNGVFSSPTLTNCTISANTEGSSIYNENNSSPKLRNSIIYGNSSGISDNVDSSPEISYSLVQGLTSTDNHNISGDTDPLFVDPTNGNYRLQLCSPVINKGSNEYYATGKTPNLSAITTDLDGEARFYGNGTVDMGAYEFHQFITTPVPGVTYVKAGETGTGTSWDCATGDLQAAINSAEDGQEVWVAGGDYLPIGSGNAFAMREGVKIYGGFEGNETSLTQRDLTKTVNTSTLLGNGYTVVKNEGNNLTPLALLDGFTITGGTGSGVYNVAASPTLSNCTITGNSGNPYGGGMCNENSSPVLINCIISGNTAITEIGGGMSNIGGSPTLINCTISSNTAIIGGSMYNSGSSPILLNTIVYGNSSGMYNYASSPDIRNSLVQGLTSTDNGNISGDTDPLFVFPDIGDYRLQPCSPVINKGSDSFYESGQTPDLSAITTDMLGEPRFYGTVDMGAYEFAGTPSTPALAGNNAEFTQTIFGNTLIGVNGSACTVIASVAPNGGAPLSGDVTAKVWVESTQPKNFVKRHYQITAAGAESATAKVTLYFTQQEFNEFNDANSVKLPVDAEDTDNYKANLRIEKRPGTSSDNFGLPGSYSGTPITINPLDPAVNGSITWNTFASRWEVSFDVTGFSGFFAKTTEAALPLNLISFTATKENGVNLLNWKTTNEINTLNFEVQSSSDAKNFTKITTLPANGSGNPTYNYQDATPYFGNVYYRLKMVDRDESFAYSKIISLMNDAVGKATVHPNPAVESITLTISPTLLQSTVTLYDITGRQLQRILLTTNKQQVDVKSLSSGVYILKFADGTAERFVKE